MDSVRLDKFLWAARFYKTRALAQQMIEAGRVRIGIIKTVQVHGRKICVGQPDLNGLKIGLAQKIVSGAHSRCPDVRQAGILRWNRLSDVLFNVHIFILACCPAGL